MAAQIKISTVGVPSERDTGVSRSVVSSADPEGPQQVTQMNPMASHSAMASNNMPTGRRV